MIIGIDTEKLEKNIELLCGQHDSGMKQSIFNVVESSFADKVMICSKVDECSNIGLCFHREKHKVEHICASGSHYCPSFSEAPACKMVKLWE